MTIIGFNFSKLLAEQRRAAKGTLKIGTNVKLDDVHQTDLSFDDERGAIKVAFTYIVTYDPDIGGVELKGDILFMQEKKVIGALVKDWGAKKSLPKKLSSALVNAIMQKCTLQAIIMTRDIGLPPPMPMPKLKSSSKVKVKEDEHKPSPPVKKKKK
ncbi:hypothetical protein GF367_01110 [Candidatus Woesearchaeota archaeon]|nr:hypothetical protein [Candidatus Woesearchaeota archaeon]